MGLLEKYKRWEAGRLHESSNPHTLAFFREQPTEKQLLILTDRDKLHARLWMTVAIVYFILGGVAGFMWGFALV